LRRRATGSDGDMKLLLFGLAIALVIYIATSGHVLFLPLLLFLPLGFLGGRSRRTRGRW
jgi:hypothetical protein